MTTKEEKMAFLRLSDVPLQEVKWLWYPYIPFGKIATLQCVLSALFKIAALKMTMGVLCVVALFFSCPAVGRLLPLCLLSSGSWGNNTSLNVAPTWGRFAKGLPKGSVPRLQSGASRASGCPPSLSPNPEGRTGRRPGPTL